MRAYILNKMTILSKRGDRMCVCQCLNCSSTYESENEEVFCSIKCMDEYSDALGYLKFENN